MSEDIPSNQTNKPSATGPVRFRSRFPKAQPNLVISSGLARIRRISGHYADKKESENNEKNSSSPSVSTSRLLVENVLSPKIATNEEETSKCFAKPNEETNTTIQSPNYTFRQLISSQSSSPAHNNVLSNSIPGSPSGTISLATVLDTNVQNYKPQFTKEHIMNIIKYKAMQKLKKIESENLKEKRKKNKKNSILFKNLHEQSANQEQTDEKIDKSKLRMKDFLYYNPKGPKKSDSSEAALERNSEQKLCSISRSNSSVSLALNSENDTNDTPESVSSKSSTIYSMTKATQPPVSLAPQLRISEDGTIVINEESLVIQRQEPEPVYESTVVESEHGDNLTYNSYRKFHHTRKWTERETAKFYKALSMVGTDFTMIQKFFSYRNRDEIKRKFKREEKINQALIDKILSKTVSIDLSFFVSSSGEEDEKNEAKSKKSKNSSSDRINRSTSGTILNENEPKKKPKLKRIQKRTFIESESESEQVDHKKKSPQIEQNKEESACLNAQTSMELDLNIEKLPPCTSLFENNNQTVEVINEQIIRDSAETKAESDNESIELVFDLDNQIINEKRNRDSDQMENNRDDSENDDGEIILDLDNNTIIQNSHWGASSISIQKLNDTDKQ